MALDPNQAETDKAALRDAARLRRQAAFDAAGPEVAQQVIRNFDAAVRVTPAQSVAGYYPVRSEMDCLALLHHLHAREIPVLLPRIVGRTEPLQFAQWQPGDPMIGGMFGIREPRADLPPIEPDIVIVPMLAFDRSGHRLGYGGGHYDRTIAHLRRRQSILAVGLAFAAQEVDRLPVGDHDERLDWIVTEQSARRTEAVAG